MKNPMAQIRHENRANTKWPISDEFGFSACVPSRSETIHTKRATLFVACIYNSLLMKGLHRMHVTVEVGYAKAKHVC